MSDSDSGESLSDGPVFGPPPPVVQPSAGLFDAATQEKIRYLDDNIHYSLSLGQFCTISLSFPGQYEIWISSNEMTSIKMIGIDLTRVPNLWTIIRTERWELAGVSTSISEIECVSQEECVEHVNASLLVDEPALTPAQQTIRQEIMKPGSRRTVAKMLMDLDKVCDRLSICLR